MVTPAPTRMVLLLGGPLGMRRHDVPAKVVAGFKIVAFRNGMGDPMPPCLYELSDKTDRGEVAVYAGLATDDDVERWRNRTR